MAYIHCVTGGSGGGIPPQLQSDMDSVLNKKLGTSTTYPSTDWAKEVNLMGLLPEKTVSGAVASFADGADDVPIKSATFEIAPTLDGVSAVNVVRSGKNLSTAPLVYAEASGSTQVTEDGKSCTRFTCSATKKYTGVKFKANTQYTVSFNAKTVRNGTPTVNSLAFVFFYTDGTNTALSVGKDDTTWTDYTLTSTAGKTVAAVGTGSSDYRLRVFVDNNTFQLEEGATATTYTPYSATTRTISLGQTVYGGSVTVDEDGECELNDEYINVTFDGSDDENWEKHGTGSASAFAMRINVDNMFLEAMSDTMLDNLKGSSGWTTIASSATWGNFDNWISKPTGVSRLITGIQSITTVDAWREYLTEHPLTVSYKKATPTTSTLTPITPITSLLGVNNIWCDTGDVETLTYRTPEVIPIPCLSSGGNQAITLPIYDDGNYTFKFKLMVFAPQNNTLILGGYWDAGCLLFHTYKVSDNYVLYYYPSNTPISAPIKFGKWMDIELAPSYMKVDGVTYQGTAASRYHNQTRLFAYDNAYGSSIALSEIEVYNSSNVKVLDLVPTKNSSGQGIFHDTVNNTDYSSTQQPCGYIEL